MKHIFPFLLLLATANPARAWWDEGHMAVAQIAYDRLAPKAKARVDALIPIGADARNNTFVTAACWADDLKKDGVHFYDDWHYQDTSFFDGVKPRDVAHEGRLLWALNQCVATLEPRFDKQGKPLPPTSDAEQARALRFLIHLVGDIHQPLHCISRYSQATPNGDRGGNEFEIAEQPRTRARNLHALWDSAGGIFTPQSKARIDRTATRRNAALVEKEFPENSVGESKEKDFFVWQRESFQTAKDVAYQTVPNQNPSAEYLAQVQTTSARRIAVAGYRLADLLNRIYAE